MCIRDRAKAMYGGRLNKNVYLDLTRKQTIGEVVSYLKSQTSYADALKDINIRHVHRGQIEDCLNQEYYHRCAKLMKYSPKSDEDFYLFEIIGVEINLIMDKLVSLQAKEQYSFNLSIPTYLAKKTSFNIDGLVNIESFKDLLQYLSKTRYYKVLKEIDFSVPFDVKEVHMCLQSLYYENIVETIKKHFKGSVQKDLLNILYTSCILYTSIDMTSQSVVDKQRLVFGDTTEYKWVVENCAKYGFIVRFTEGTDGITGISHEPWHLRYVGKKVAKEIKDQNWTLEEYCLYKNVIPKFKKD